MNSGARLAKLLADSSHKHSAVLPVYRKQYSVDQRHDVRLQGLCEQMNSNILYTRLYAHPYVLHEQSWRIP